MTSAETEKASYFFFDVHHTVFDGTSFHALLSDIEAIYRGKTELQDIRLASVPGHQPVSNNVLFIAITALALAHYSKKRCVNFEWVYNGRSSVRHMSTVGLLFNILPLSVALSDNPSFS